MPFNSQTLVPLEIYECLSKGWKASLINETTIIFDNNERHVKDQAKIEATAFNW